MVQEKPKMGKRTKTDSKAVKHTADEVEGNKSPMHTQTRSGKAKPLNYRKPNEGYTEYTAVDMYSDASRHFEKGFGAYCGKHWCYGQWDTTFTEANKPSIQYLELFGVAVAVTNWLHLFKNKRIYLFCDNQSVIKMINNSSARCKNCMVLIRMITLHSLQNNTRVFAKYVPTLKNDKADALSRLDLARFWRMGGHAMNSLPSKIHPELWPMDKVWCN